MKIIDSEIKAKGGSKTEAGNTWFEVDDDGCLKIKTASKAGDTVNERAFILEREETVKLKNFLGKISF
jgi:hypothetical protein